MIQFEALKSDLQELPEEAQQLVMDYVEFLKEKYQTSSNLSQPLSLENEEFVGMWENRPETQNSQEWLNQLRQEQWNR